MSLNSKSPAKLPIYNSGRSPAATKVIRKTTFASKAKAAKSVTASRKLGRRPKTAINPLAASGISSSNANESSAVSMLQPLPDHLRWTQQLRRARCSINDPICINTNNNR